MALALVLPATAKAAGQSGPAAPVEALDQGILAIMRAGRATRFAQRAQIMEPVTRDAFDLPAILHNSVGPRFASFPPAAQADLLDVFTQFTVASYVANFDEYDGERFEILPERRRVGADEVVATRMVHNASDPLRLDYVVRRGDAGWKIIDVLLNGSISRVAVQRSDFRSLLGAGDAAPLIASLRRKTAQLADGHTS